jgi:hypothetical protein
MSAVSKFLSPLPPLTAEECLLLQNISTGEPLNGQPFDQLPFHKLPSAVVSDNPQDEADWKQIDFSQFCLILKKNEPSLVAAREYKQITDSQIPLIQILKRVLEFRRYQLPASKKDEDRWYYSSDFDEQMQKLHALADVATQEEKAEKVAALPPLPDLLENGSFARAHNTDTSSSDMPQLWEMAGCEWLKPAQQSGPPASKKPRHNIHQGIGNEVLDEGSADVGSCQNGPQFITELSDCEAEYLRFLIQVHGEQSVSDICTLFNQAVLLERHINHETVVSFLKKS